MPGHTSAWTRGQEGLGTSRASGAAFERAHPAAQSASCRRIATRKAAFPPGTVPGDSRSSAAAQHRLAEESMCCCVRLRRQAGSRSPRRFRGPAPSCAAGRRTGFPGVRHG
ncbi:MAG: hypothetical protein FJ109_11485 [Deltaproteobacteria bacterium]|nr:hypothetical protein [Deltaproteobacteria bacterium]